LPPGSTYSPMPSGTGPEVHTDDAGG
jgi:hypothetical protein